MQAVGVSVYHSGWKQNCADTMSAILVAVFAYNFSRLAASNLFFVLFFFVP